MSDTWLKYKFSDFVEINPTIRFSKDEKYSFVEMKDLNENNKFTSPSTEKSVTGGARFEEKDTLFARITPCLQNGKICQVKGLKNNVGFGSTEFLIFRGKNGISDTDFVYYLSREEGVRKFAEQNMIGTSGRQRVVKDAFHNLILELPPLKEQKAIAEILSSLDDKIELNLQTNKTLEEMANALYKHWFVDFGPFRDGKFFKSDLQLIPEGWELKKFSELYDLRKGLSYRSKDYADDGIPMINLKCVDRNGGFRYDGIKYYKGEYKSQHIVEAGDLLIAMTDLTQDRSVLGSPLFAPNIKTKSHVIASLDISILKQIDKNLPNLNLYFYYLMRTPKYHEYILGFGNGSTVVHLDKLGIVNYKALLPSANVIEQFNSHVSVIRNSIELNIDENISLKETRDYLLSKLISGEIRVKEASKKVKEVL